MEIKPLSNIAVICANYAKAVGKKSILEIRPIEKAAVSSPLFMDAKATLAKLNITTPINEKKYQKFAYEIRREMELYVSKEVKPIISQINPITSANIDAIKLRLEPLLKNLGSSDKQEILSCKTPNELLAKIKYNYDDIFYNNELSEIYNKAKDEGVTPDLEKRYQTLAKKEFDNINNLFDLIANKSKKPEVIKMEEDVRALGVGEVNFSDDKDQGKLIKLAIEDLAKKKIPLPTSIKVSPIIPTEYGGLTLSGTNKCIYMPSSKMDELMIKVNLHADELIMNFKTYNNAPPEYKEKFLKEIKEVTGTQHSTKNLKHRIYHEIGHTFEQQNLKADTRVLSDAEMKTAKEISMYASVFNNGQEIVPEMLAMLMDGQKLTDKQMALYLKLGGIVPQL